MNLQLPQNIKGIIFDLDGTLYKMKWFMKPLLTIILFPRMLLLPRYISIRKLFAGKEMENGDKLLYAMAEKLAERCGKHKPERTLIWINNNFYKAFDCVMPLLRGSRHGLINTLESLKEKGYKLAVLSDFGHVKQRLSGLGIPTSLFDNIASCEEEGSLKPCIKSLLAIADSWQVQSSDILVIGDRDDTDGIAASKAGMAFIKISDKNPKPEEAHDWSAVKTCLSNLSSI